MIKYILVQNRQGKTRLAKWYIPLDIDEQNAMKGDIHRLVASRESKSMANFVEFQSHKIVYRRYAGLFFCFGVDATDNPLAYLESIHLFVEILDAFFKNVCELDLVFNFYLVYAIIDEIILGGELQEFSKQTVLNRLELIVKQEWFWTLHHWW